MSQTIQIKRTTKQASTITDSPEYGEPVYLKGDDEFTIGIGSSQPSSSIKDLKVVKFVSQALANMGVFYGVSSQSSVTLKNNANQDIYPVTKAENVTYTNAQQITTTVKAALDNKQDSISTLPVNKGGTGVQSITAGHVVVGNGTNVTSSRAIATTLDSSTKIPTCNAVTTAINSSWNSKKYAGSQSVGGAANTVVSSANTTQTKVFVTGVTAANGAHYYCNNAEGTENTNGIYFNCATGVLFGAAWNDFAEFRKCNAPAGTVVCEQGDGSLLPSGERLQAGGAVISDTYGMVIGAEEPGYSPVAVAGRVLVNYIGDVSNYTPGAAVCAGPFGRVDIMTRDEIKEYPDRIVGYVSEIPTYDEWNNVKVNNRLWIKIK